jgi:hypothetical protein
MNRADFDPAKSADHRCVSKNIAWNMVRKRLASRQRNRPVRVAPPETPEPKGFVWRRRKIDNETPAERRRLTKSPDTGLDASPLGASDF